MKTTSTLAVAAALGVAALLAGCVPNAGTDGASASITVESTADECIVGADSVASGTVTFTVSNSGDRITEFYLLGEDELSIVSEVENIAPGASRDLTVLAQPGKYFTVCKPGMIGEGIGQAEFTVTGDVVESSADEEAAVAEAVTRYTAYVKSQAAELVPKTEEFVAAYIAGDDEKARALFPLVRVNYERIEPTAAQFGDLDPAIDYRKPGAEAEGLEFTGFHRIEMDLWLDAAQANYPDETIAALDQAGRETIGTKLVEDVTTLYYEVHSEDFALSVSDITNGAIGLLDEVATGKVTGEEEFWSHTDLWDFQANIDGAKVLYAGVRDILLEEDADLAADLDSEFAELQKLLDAQRVGEDFTLYTDLTPAEIKAFADQVNALGEPLNQLTATLVL